MIIVQIDKKCKTPLENSQGIGVYFEIAGK
jgi:hypothetical protein